MVVQRRAFYRDAVPVAAFASHPEFFEHIFNSNQTILPLHGFLI
jgi:hypothetical protein